jgi:hypothetical protein
VGQDFTERMKDADSDMAQHPGCEKPPSPVPRLEQADATHDREDAKSPRWRQILQAI